MSNPYMVHHLHVDDPSGRLSPGGLVILSGDAPVWKYCDMFHQCVTEGAGVIAIAHGIDTKTNSAASIVAYSNSAEFQIGQTIHTCEERTRLSAFIEKWGHEEGVRRFQAGLTLYTDEELYPNGKPTS